MQKRECSKCEKYKLMRLTIIIIIRKIILLCVKGKLNSIRDWSVSRLLTYLILLRPDKLPSSLNRFFFPLAPYLGMGNIAFSVIAPKLKNKLTINICLSSSISPLKHSLKTHLF